MSGGCRANRKPRNRKVSIDKAPNGGDKLACKGPVEGVISKENKTRYRTEGAKEKSTKTLLKERNETLTKNLAQWKLDGQTQARPSKLTREWFQSKSTKSDQAKRLAHSCAKRLQRRPPPFGDTTLTGGTDGREKKKNYGQHTIMVSSGAGGQ